jgi:hypothetical protein
MKIKKTFTIDKDIWKKFYELCNKNSINKSLLLENYIKKIVLDNDNDKSNID